LLTRTVSTENKTLNRTAGFYAFVRRISLHEILLPYAFLFSCAAQNFLIRKSLVCVDKSGADVACGRTPRERAE